MWTSFLSPHESMERMRTQWSQHPLVPGVAEFYGWA